MNFMNKGLLLMMCIIALLKKLIEEAKIVDDVVYAVPGSPLVAEKNSSDYQTKKPKEADVNLKHHARYELYGSFYISA